MLDTTSIIFTVEAVPYWPQFAAALNDAVVNNNGDSLMEWYIAVTGYIPETNSYTSYNYSAVSSAGICKDYSIPDVYNHKWGWVGAMNRLRHQYPILGGMANVMMDGTLCINWPETSDPLLPENPSPIEGATPTVLLINDLYDPRGLVASAQALSTYLTNLNVKNKLLVWNGVGHMSYAYNAPVGGCIDTNVDHFFATGQLPTVDVCNDKTNPFINPPSNQNFSGSQLPLR